MRGACVDCAQMPSHEEHLNQMFQALADPTRRAMVQQLTRGPVSVSDLARPLPITMSAVVQHLGVLEASGLVRSEKVGRVRTCWIEDDALAEVEQWISRRRAHLERRLDRLEAHLAGGPADTTRRKQR
jgi:DNA-binding transcriptional ArsR family regulator